MPESNLKKIRRLCGLSQEQVAEKLNVSRQAVAKWESGDSLPDIYNCRALADLYDITIDSLFSAVTDRDMKHLKPKGKHIFGAVRVEKDGTLKLPKKAMKIFDIKEGDLLIVLGDESQGIAMCKTDLFTEAFKSMREAGFDGFDDIGSDSRETE